MKATGITSRGRTLAASSLALFALGLLIPSSASAFTTLYTCNPSWPASEVPVQYSVNQTPPSTIPAIADVRDIFQTSFETWSSPCCSSFAASDAGLTTATGDNQNDSTFALSFMENSWSQALGDVNSTLGVTIPLVTNSCVIVSADVVFNQYRFDFIDGFPRGQWEADLESIATHEFGHFLGLGHTGIQDATMFASYIGGTEARTLHSDDEDGVCSLYPQSCSCQNSTQCNSDQECIDGQCQLAPCIRDSECDPGLSCVSGDCVVPPCGSDDDCIGGYVCANDGACIPNPQCPICGECSTNADCGSNGICIPAGYVDQRSHCSAACNTGSDCPGDTECFTLQTEDGDIPLCLNADANTRGICPADFVCQDTSTTNPDLCASVTCAVGQTCNAATGQCQGSASGGCAVCTDCASGPEVCGGGTCLAFDGGPSVCSQPCGTDGACPGNSSCFELSDNNSWCLNNDAGTAGVCTSNWQCETESGGVCAGVSCGNGQTCNPGTGLCEGGSTTSDDSCNVCTDCTNNQRACGSSTCLTFDAGASVCSVPCGAGGSCPGNSACFELNGGEKWCLNDNAASIGLCGAGWACDTTFIASCDGVTCGLGQSCNPATGLCEGGVAPDNPDTGTPTVGRPSDPDPAGNQEPEDEGCTVAGRPQPKTALAAFAIGFLAILTRRRTRKS